MDVLHVALIVIFAPVFFVLGGLAIYVLCRLYWAIFELMRFYIVEYYTFLRRKLKRRKCRR